MVAYITCIQIIFQDLMFWLSVKGLTIVFGEVTILAIAKIFQVNGDFFVVMFLHQYMKQQYAFSLMTSGWHQFSIFSVLCGRIMHLLKLP